MPTIESLSDGLTGRLPSAAHHGEEIRKEASYQGMASAMPMRALLWVRLQALQAKHSG
ncbi:MAG TPA: hypothetical protein VJ756_14700 [Terriglobales bacterium]|nr:hypothetical protein [Terriglobales bacterium]